MSSRARKILKRIGISTGALFAALVVYGLVTGHSSPVTEGTVPSVYTPAGAPSTGPDLQLSCALGYVGSGGDYEIEPSTFTPVETSQDQQLGYSPAIQVTATNDNPVSVSRIA